MASHINSFDYIVGKTCRIFIDHEGRLYKNWEAFLTENHLPKSVMVVPTNGEYKAMILPVCIFHKVRSKSLVSHAT